MPLLMPYLFGVAFTCMATFLMGFLHFVMSDSTVICGNGYQSVYKTKPLVVDQRTIDQTFSSISAFLMMLHLFWFLFGSINILPAVFIESLYISNDMLRIKNCAAPVHFWFSFLCLCLQWFLFIVVAIWYKVEMSTGAEDDRSNDHRSEDAKNVNQDKQHERNQYLRLHSS